jgi:hypothetical protein
LLGAFPFPFTAGLPLTALPFCLGASSSSDESESEESSANFFGSFLVEFF